MNSKLVSFFKTALKISFAALVIGWLIRSGKFDISTLKLLLTPTYLISCFILVFLQFFVGSERWRYLLQSQGFQLTVMEAFRLSMIGAFFNFAMPGGVGGDVVKAYYVIKENEKKKMKVLFTIAMDRILGLFGMLLIALMAFAFDIEKVLQSDHLRTIFYLLLLCFLGFLTIFGLGFSKILKHHGVFEKLLHRFPIGDRLIRAYDSFHSYGKFKILLNSLLYSFVSQIFGIFMLIIVGQAVSPEPVSIKTYFFVVPIAAMITAIPISPAGVGVGQAAFYFLFNLYLQKPTSIGPAIITGGQIINFLFSLMGAFWYIQRGRKKTTPVVL